MTLSSRLGQVNSDKAKLITSQQNRQVTAFDQKLLEPDLLDLEHRFAALGFEHQQKERRKQQAVVH